MCQLFVSHQHGKYFWSNFTFQTKQSIHLLLYINHLSSRLEVKVNYRSAALKQCWGKERRERGIALGLYENAEYRWRFSRVKFKKQTAKTCKDNIRIIMTIDIIYAFNTYLLTCISINLTLWDKDTKQNIICSVEKAEQVRVNAHGDFMHLHTL